MSDTSEFIETEHGAIWLHPFTSHQVLIVTSLSPSLSLLWVFCCFSSLWQCFDSIFVLLCLSQMGAVLCIKPVALWEPGAALSVAALIGYQREGIWSNQVSANRSTGKYQSVIFVYFTLCSFYSAISYIWQYALTQDRATPIWCLERGWWGYKTVYSLGLSSHLTQEEKRWVRQEIK